MICRHLFSMVLASTFSLLALDIMPGGFIPSEHYRQDVRPTQDKDAFFQFREQRTILVAPDSTGKLQLELSNARVGKNPAYLDYALYDIDGSKILKSGKIQVGKKLALVQNGLAKGVYRLSVNAGGNATIISKATGVCCADASSGNPLVMVYHCPKLYFIPTGETLKLEASGSAPREHIQFTVWDADGKVVYSANTAKRNRFHRLQPVLSVPKNQIGKVWSMKIDPVQGLGFEDMKLAILEGASTIVALTPDSLILPPFSFIHKNIGQDTFLGISLCQRLAEVKGATLDFAFATTDDSEPFNATTSWKQGDKNLELGFRLPAEKLFQGTATVSFKDADGNILLKDTQNITICEGTQFTEQVRQEPGMPAAPSGQDKARGFMTWQRDEPGFIRAASRPATEEITAHVKAESNPGLISAEFFAIQPLRNFDNAALTIGKLTATDGSVIPENAVKLMPVRIWGQRTDWNATTYIRAPELIELKDTVTLKTGKPQPYCIRIQLPKNTKPGIYKAEIAFNGTACLNYELTVHDFTLPEYNDMTFGLYADGERWHKKNYSDMEVLNEYRMFRDYGMNALIVYPFTGAVINYDRNTKKWDVNFDVFRHHMKLYVQTGFKGILVVSLQAAKSAFSNALNAPQKSMTPELEAGYRAVFAKISEFAKEDNWPDYCIHTIDEPHDQKDVEEAVSTLKLVHDAGFKTFNTCYGDFVRKYLAPYLDYRCYNQVAFRTSLTKARNDTYREESLAAKSHFWWYGSGCYTNGGLMQDCNIYSNRHMLGIFNFRSGATGAWTWTFLRAKGDVFNDFDGSSKREAKEACICYPTPNGNGLINTLQWEACREGIYDYRYLRLWKDLAEKAANSQDKKQLALDSKKKINGIMDSISWTCLRFSVSNGQLRALRTALISEINKLK